MGGDTGDTAIRPKLKPYEIALLRGGPRAAVTVAVLALRLRDAVEPGRPGTIRAAEQAPQTPSPLSPFEDAVLASLHEPAGLRELVKRADVRLAVALVRVDLAEAGLLRYPLLGPTRQARRQVHAMRERHPLPASRHGLTDHDKLLAVALHGEPALRMLVPRFALRAGLTARAEVADKGMLRRSRRGGTSGGGTSGAGYCCGSSCGGGGGTD